MGDYISKYPLSDIHIFPDVGQWLLSLECKLIFMLVTKATVLGCLNYITLCEIFEKFALGVEEWLRFTHLVRVFVYERRFFVATLGRGLATRLQPWKPVSEATARWTCSLWRFCSRAVRNGANARVAPPLRSEGNDGECLIRLARIWTGFFQTFADLECEMATRQTEQLQYNQPLLCAH